MITLLQNATAVAPNLTVPFQGVGGTGPYTYSIVPGGIGGTIGATSGIYTAPGITGTDTIQVIDSLLDTATGDILVGAPVQLVADIIKREMSLANDQVYLWDQKVNTPNDSRLYVVLGVVSCKPFGQGVTMDGSGSGLDAINSANFRAVLSINIFSRGTQARDRKEEVVLALGSFYAEQQQELNCFRIFPVSGNFLNLSNVDGAAIPYQFNISAVVQYFVTKRKAVEYYDHNFTPSILTNA